MSRTVQMSWVAGALLALGGCAAAPTDTVDQMDASPTGGAIASGGSEITGGTLDATGGTPIATGGTPIATGGTVAPAPTSDLPCDVAEVVATHCQKCHGATTNFGAPMSLVSVADFKAMGKGFADDSMTTPVHTLVTDRVNRDTGTTGVMPPAGQMPAADLAILTDWLEGGMTAGTGACEQPAPGGMTGGDNGGTEFIDEPGWGPEGMPEETCYQFLKHGGQLPGDETPHMVETRETYVNFYYKVPWTEPSVATRWRTIYDKTQVLHHWLMYESLAPTTRDGNWESLSTDAITSGAHVTASTLVAGWAVGGGDEAMPEGVGMRMPAPGTMMELEWHLYNNGAPIADRSGVEICVIPEAKMNPKHVADMTWLGTENLTILPGQDTVAGGVCNPSFATSDEIHVAFWQPHMHTIGHHMDTWLMHPDGTEEHVFSEPFQFDRQISYRDGATVIKRGDTLDVHCTFRNPAAAVVPFGQSTQKEMCYQFVVAYPAGALRAAPPFDGVLTGARNGCLAFPSLPLPHAN